MECLACYFTSVVEDLVYNPDSVINVTVGKAKGLFPLDFGRELDMFKLAA